MVLNQIALLTRIGFPLWRNKSVLSQKLRQQRLCKYCYIDYNSSVYLEVQYSDKEKNKSYGGMFDPVYKNGM